MKLRQPTRWPKTAMTSVERTMSRIKGTIHVGRCAIESNVGFGLNTAPKIRPTELSEPVATGLGAGALAMCRISSGPVECFFSPQVRLKAKKISGPVLLFSGVEKQQDWGGGGKLRRDFRNCGE
jgi:hypothetical protein